MKKVLLIGETCDDVFIYGTVNRLSPEAPIPVINPIHTITNKGMAENVKLNLESLGIVCDFITNNEKVTKTRYVDDSYNYILLRIDENDIVQSLDNINDLDKYDYLIIADYNKGLLKKEFIENITKHFKGISFIDTKKKLGKWCSYIDFIKINFNEYERSKNFIKNNNWIDDKLIVTRGKYGCDYKQKTYPTKEVSIKDVAGAGDTFLAGLIFKYIQTNSIEDSLDFANKCSTQVVQKRGVSVVDKTNL